MNDEPQEELSLFAPESSRFDKNASRFDYDRPVYRDAWCAVIYYLVIASVLAITIFIWVVKWPEIEEHNDSLSSNASETSIWSTSLDYTGYYVVLLCVPLLGLMFGFLWLHILRSAAGALIKVMLLLNAALWLTVSLVGFVDDSTEMGMIGLILAMVTLLYAWCVWARIRFAAVLLVKCFGNSRHTTALVIYQQSLGSRIVATYVGVVCVQLTSIVLSIAWCVVIASCLWDAQGRGEPEHHCIAAQRPRARHGQHHR